MHCVGTEERIGVLCVAWFVVILAKRGATPADQRPVKSAQDCGGGVCPAGCPSITCGRGFCFSLGGHSALSITPADYSSNL